MKVISHTLLEKEFDRELMIETNRDPHHFYPSDCIVPRVSYARVIHRVFPNISTKTLFFCLRMMKFITNMMVYDNNGKRRFLVAAVTRVVGKKRSEAALEHFMQKEPVVGAEEPVRELREYFDRAVEEAPGYLEELFRLSREELPLSERWYRTYNG